MSGYDSHVTSADAASNTPRWPRSNTGTAALFALGAVAGAAAGCAWPTDRPSQREPEPAAGDAAQLQSDVLDAIGTAVCVVDAGDRITYANGAAAVYGIRSGETVPSHTLRALTKQVRDTGTRRYIDTSLSHAVEVRVGVFPLPGGEVALELTDISEQHRVEKVRHDFVANVGHELKTPVGALQLLAEALVEAADDPQTATRFAARIQHESSRMARLVSELLELSRLQGAEPMPQPEPVWIDRVITEALDRSWTAASAKDIKLEREGDVGVIVSGSESQLTTALSNLIGNAIAYSPADTTVRIVLEHDHAWMQLKVIDEGIGIQTSDLDRIFERFYRADPARSRQTGGTGLGLAIVKHVVVNHGGRIDVASTPGEGATFTLVLPTVASPPPATQEENQEGTH